MEFAARTTNGHAGLLRTAIRACKAAWPRSGGGSGVDGQPGIDRTGCIGSRTDDVGDRGGGTARLIGIRSIAVLAFLNTGGAVMGSM